MTSPTPSTSSSCCNDAFMSVSMSPKCRAIRRAEVSPTKRMPRAKTTLSNGTFFELSMALTIFCAERSLLPPPLMSSTFMSYRSAML